MWVVSAFVFLANPLLGAVLLLSAAVTTGLKVAKVDTEYAKHGKTPPSYALVEKWLERRKAAGRAPKSAKVAKPGMWSYAWQRWQAMWEDLAGRHKEVRDQYKTAAAEAKANGEVPPPKPTLKETLTGWKWHLDQLAPPSIPAPPPQGAGAGQLAPGPGATPTNQAGQRPWNFGTSGVNNPGRLSNQGTCRKCGQDRPLTTVDWCEPCVTAAEHGFCSTCDGLMIRDGDVFRHGPRQPCTGVAPVANKVPPPGAKPSPGPGRCSCGRQLLRWRDNGNQYLFCPVCDGVHTGTPSREACPRCLTYGYVIQVRPDRGAATQRKTGRFLIHELTRTNRCPSAEQVTKFEGIRPADRPGPALGLQQSLSSAARTARKPSPRPAGTTANPAPENQPPHQQGDPMTQTAQSGEVTGIPSAVNYMTKVAETHNQHGGNEQILTAMNNMNIGAGDIALVQEAQEASRNAAELWTTAKDTIDTHNAGVREGYGSAPDAADKTAQMAE